MTGEPNTNVTPAEAYDIVCKAFHEHRPEALDSIFEEYTRDPYSILEYYNRTIKMSQKIREQEKKKKEEDVDDLVFDFWREGDNMMFILEYASKDLYDEIPIPIRHIIKEIKHKRDEDED